MFPTDNFKLLFMNTKPFENHNFCKNKVIKKLQGYKVKYYTNTNDKPSCQEKLCSPIHKIYVSAT